MEKSEELHRQIAQAAENVAAAEKELQAALEVIQSVERTEKQMISSRLESAFARLAATRQVLEAALDNAG